MEKPDPAALAAILDTMWDKYLPQIEERVVTLERAGALAAAGSLDPEACQEAMSAAHKLAGVLGTFGLDQGTGLAREAEAYYAGGVPAAGRDERPAAVAAQLRAIMASRKR